MNEVDHGRIPLTKKTFGALLARWRNHIETRGRAPKTLVENRRMAATITEDLGTTDLQKLKGADLDATRAPSLLPASPRLRVLQPRPGTSADAPLRITSAYSIGRVAIPVGSRPASTQPTMAATTGIAITMRNRLLQGM